ncbi:MAG: recombinase family protein [Anaerovoracaceae bacterium]
MSEKQNISAPTSKRGNIDAKFLTKLRLLKQEGNEVVKKRAIYIRVSTKEQAMLGYGLDAQMSNIYKELEIEGVKTDEVESYIDDGYSAKDLNRPELQRLLKDILDGKVNEIIIYKLDRLARNVIDTYELLQFFIDQNCELKAVVDSLDIHSANGRLLVGVLAIIAQWERETIRERTIDAIVEMLDEGKFPFGGIPYGWIKDKEGHLSYKEDEAEIVRYCFTLASNGNTMKEIEYKAKLRYPNFKKNSETIRRMLLREANYGRLYYQGKDYSNIIPALVTKNQYDRAYRMIFKRYKKTDENFYYFGNKIIDVCESVCERKSSKKTLKSGIKRYYYYMCPICKNRINQEKIIDATLMRIFAFAKNKNKKENHTRLSNRMRILDRKSKDIYMQFIADKIDASMYGKTIGMIEDEKNSIIQMLKVFINKNNKNLFNWNSMSDKERKLFIDEYVAEIVVDTTLNLIISIDFIK